MKLTSTAKDRYQFQLSSREKDLLLQVLRLYPQVPSSYQPLSKSTRADESNQRLLDEALDETRMQNKKEVAALLADPARLRQQGGTWHLTLSASGMESLLQSLNDVRVGSWIRLGSPEVPLQVLNAETAPHIWAMEMAGSFQMRFLELLGP